jgi:amidophosphoribosyltransferase
VCGLCGVIVGRKRHRPPDELATVSNAFTRLLVLNETRGTDAAGVAVIRRNGTCSLLKSPGPAHRLIQTHRYDQTLTLDGEVTALLGHTRHKTRGSALDNRNDHPLPAGKICGTHNGHIANADELAVKYGLARQAEVDSEVLFLLADRARSMAHFLRLFADCRGRVTAVFVRLYHPNVVHLLKGNMPLAAAFVPSLHAVFYSSEAALLGMVLHGLPCKVVPLAAYTLTSLDGCRVPASCSRRVTFDGEEDARLVQ